MLSLQNAGKRFGPRVLFLEANWLIRAREKTALVGANGTGKSTLMKVLAGLEALDYGALQQTKGMSIGYLPQEGLRLTGRTVFEECLTVFDELRDMEREIEHLAGQLAVLDHAGPEYESAAERFSMLQERFHTLDGYALDEENKYTSGGVSSTNPPSEQAKQYAELVMGHIDCDTTPLMWNYANKFTLFDNVFQTATGPSTPGTSTGSLKLGGDHHRRPTGSRGTSWW